MGQVSNLPFGIPPILTPTEFACAMTQPWIEARIEENVLVTTYPGGLLALPTNMGRYSRSKFAVMSELDVFLRCELTPELRLRFGYTLVTWSDVDRAADQIDVGVNPSQVLSGNLVGEARPAFTPRSTSFWAQGLNVGLECQF